MNESERIKKAYNKRKIQQKGNLYIVQSRERIILGLLREFNFLKLSDKKILDIGCGDGGGKKKLRNFIK